MTLRVQCWSGPRNISTALMYSFRQRSDTTVVDEPLYAHYLSMADRGHPLTDAVLASQSTDADDVIQRIILGPCETPVLFVKQMAHHLQGIEPGFLGETSNILLTRDPRQMLASLSVNLPDCELADTGLSEQIELLDAIEAGGGRPVVIESRALLSNPEGVLAAVCKRLGLDFDDAMLSWPAGPKPEDGVWASEWYRGVHASTGFGRYVPGSGALSDRLEAVLEEATPLYKRILEFATLD